MVTNQNTARPAIAPAKASTISLRSIACSFRPPFYAVAPWPENQRAARRNGRPSWKTQNRRSALLRPIVLVAAAAILGDRRERGLEGVEVLHLRLRLLCVRGEFFRLGLEVGHVGPDCRQRRSVAARLRGFGE